VAANDPVLSGAPGAGVATVPAEPSLRVVETRASRVNRRREPEVLVSAEEVKGFELLLASLRDGGLDASLVDRVPLNLQPGVPPPTIAIEPVEISQVSFLSFEEGVTP
jgi:hypothetical protein